MPAAGILQVGGRLHGIKTVGEQTVLRGRVDLSKTTYRGLHLGVTYANWLLNGPMEIYGNTPARPRAH